MINPNGPVNITRAIHKTALSMPLDFASRATQINNAILIAKKTMGTSIKRKRLPPQTPQPAQVSPGPGSARRCPNAALTEKSSPTDAEKSSWRLLTLKDDCILRDTILDSFRYG